MKNLVDYINESLQKKYYQIVKDIAIEAMDNNYTDEEWKKDVIEPIADGNEDVIEKFVYLNIIDALNDENIDVETNKKEIYKIIQHTAVDWLNMNK